MGARSGGILVLTALVLAAVVASVGACSTSEPEAAAPLVESRAETVAEPTGEQPLDPAAPTDFGIDLSEAVPSTPPGSGAAGEATDPPGTSALEALKALDAPAQGQCVGEVLGSDGTVATVAVRIDTFTAVVGTGSSTERITLPEGSRVTLVLVPRPGTQTPEPPEQGRTIQADIKIEPAAGDRPGRIVAVNIEVMGAKR